MIVLEALPAAYGDSVWVECARAGAAPWRMLVDGGPPESWPSVRARIARLPAGRRHIDLVVITHVDSDHIGGMLPLFSDMDLGVTFGDVWFNALEQLPDPATGTMRSVGEGESLARALSGASSGETPPWSVAFDGAAVVTGGDRGLREIRFPDGPTITLLSPTPKRLLALRRVWLDAVGRLRRGESEDTPLPVPRELLKELAALADTVTRTDTSIPNGSSIAFLLEYEGTACLFAADAFPTVLGSALWTLANARGCTPIALDAVKLPHHGSRGNVTSKLLALVPARHYVVSTNGERFDHPHDVTLARVLTSGARSPTLWFNYDTPVHRRWDDATLRKRYGYAVRFPAADGIGARLELP